MKPHAFVLKISVLSMMMMLGAVGTSWAEGTTENKTNDLFPGISIDGNQVTVPKELLDNVIPVTTGHGGQQWDLDSFNKSKDKDKTYQIESGGEINYHSSPLKARGEVFMGGAKKFIILPNSLMINDKGLNAYVKIAPINTIEFSNEGISFAGQNYITIHGLNANKQNIQDVFDGEVKKGSKDAVNGGQLWEVKQLIGNGSVDMTPVYRVGALSAAMAGLQPLPFDKDHRFSMSAAVGHYHGQNALAVGMGYYFKRNLRVNAGASVQNARDKMFNLGVAYRFGGSSDAENFIAANELNHSQGEIQRLIQEVVVYQNKTTKLESELAKTKGSMAQELKAMQQQINELKQLIQKKK